MKADRSDDLIRLPTQLLERGRTLAIRLYAAIRTIRVHGPRNDAFHQAVAELRREIEELMAHGDGVLELRLDGDMVILNGSMVPAAAVGVDQLRALSRLLYGVGVGGLRFQTFDAPELLPAWLAPFETNTEDLEELAWPVFEQLALRGLVTHPPKRISREDLKLIEVSTRAFAIQTFARAVVAFREFVRALQEGRDPFLGRLNLVRVVQDLVDVASAHPTHLLEVLAARHRQPTEFEAACGAYVHRHAAAVCAYALLIGRELGLKRLQMLDLGTSALLAKVGAALGEQEDPGRPLSDEEKLALRKASAEALEGLVGRSRTGAQMLRRLIVAYEHALPDPPEGPAGLHPYSRMVAVADAFDALTSDRSWRKAVPVQEALLVLGREPRYDAVAVRALASRCELSS